MADHALGAIKRFFRTPKGLLVGVLAILIILAAPGVGLARVGPGLAAASAVAVVVDVPILRWRDGAWSFPSGALLTAWIVAMVLSPLEPWYVPAVTTAIGLASKHLLRIRTTNVFNPAALALVIAYYLFDAAQSWWGALPEVAAPAIAVLLASGLYVAARINKLPLVLAFLGSYYVLFTATAFAGDPAAVAEVFRAPDLHAALFFAFFMLTDPPTSPPKPSDQLWCGGIAGIASYLVFEWVGAVYFLLAGLLAANVWEAWRRLQVRTGSAAARA